MENKAQIYIEEKQEWKTIAISSKEKPQISKKILIKWQNIINSISELLRVKAAMLMRITNSYLEVVITSENHDNPISAGMQKQLGQGLYCENVIGNNLYFFINQAVDWQNQFPEVDFDMISYLGFPLLWPDGEFYGTICVLDNKSRKLQRYLDILENFKAIIESDLKRELEIQQFEITINNQQQTIKDLEEKKAATQITNKRLNSIIDTSPSGIAIVDENGIFKYTNTVSSEIHGYGSEEIIGRDIRSFLYNEDRETGYQILREMTHSKGNIHLQEIRFIHKETNKPIWVRMNFNKFPKISEFETDSVLIIFNDITERKQKEKELLSLSEKAKKASQLKSEFLANMSHEIRTPLNAVIGFSEILMDKLTDPALKKYIDLITKSANNLLNIINDILDLSKIEAGKIEIRNQFFSIQSVIEDIFNMQYYMIENKNLSYKIKIDPAFPDVFLDEIRLSQILLNLIGNAVKFTNEGEIRCCVELQKKRDHSIDFQIQVQDTGIGIPKDEQEYIFESFNQMHKQNQRKYGGTGLGLAIVHKLVFLMGGILTLESRVNKGSTFSIDFYNVDFRPPKLTGIKKVKKMSRFCPAKILVVDDLLINIEIIKKFLAHQEGLKLLEASSAGEALSLLQNHTPDLIIMDLRMPGKDGVQVTREIREVERLKEVPILAYTASVYNQDTNLFNGTLNKPVTRDDLNSILEKFLAVETIETDKAVAKKNSLSREFESINDGQKKLILEKIRIKFKPTIKRLILLKNYDEILNYANMLEKFLWQYPIPLLKEKIADLISETKAFHTESLVGILKEIQAFFDKIEVENIGAE